MNTPIVDFARGVSAAGTARFFMPGHKGKRILGFEESDITEITGADALYEASGIIGESERNAAALFGTGRTFYSTEGASHAVRAMLHLAAKLRADPSGRPLVLAARNAHVSFLSAAALLDFDVSWLYPEKSVPASVCSFQPSPGDLRRRLAVPPRPDAVYITSPDYLGRTADVRGLAAAAAERGIPLLVDNAHGAYLHFLDPPRHPLDLGAAMSADSAHKTLPVLTGGAYLQLSREADAAVGAEGKAALALFGSTSPSYLTLQSLDACNGILGGDYPRLLGECVRKLDGIRGRLRAQGYPVLRTDPLKLVLSAAAMGVTGDDIAAALAAFRVEGEYWDDDHFVLMATPANGEDEFARLEAALASVPPGRPPREPRRFPPRARRRLGIREAVMARQVSVPVEEAAGRVAGAPASRCPPAVPVVLPGEEISEEAAELLRAWHVPSVAVVR